MRPWQQARKENRDGGEQKDGSAGRWGGGGVGGVCSGVSVLVMREREAEEKRENYGVTGNREQTGNGTVCIIIFLVFQYSRYPC